MLFSLKSVYSLKLFVQMELAERAVDAIYNTTGYNYTAGISSKVLCEYFVCKVLLTIGHLCPN